MIYFVLITSRCHQSIHWHPHKKEWTNFFVLRFRGGFVALRIGWWESTTMFIHLCPSMAYTFLPSLFCFNSFFFSLTTLLFLQWSEKVHTAELKFPDNVQKFCDLWAEKFLIHLIKKKSFWRHRHTKSSLNIILCCWWGRKNCWSYISYFSTFHCIYLLFAHSVKETPFPLFSKNRKILIKDDNLE